MSLELCAAGVPALLVAIADNQVRPCEAMARLGMATYCGLSAGIDARRLRDATTEFFHSQDLRRHIQEYNRTVFVTPGGSRIGHELREGMDRKSREVLCPAIS